MRYFVLDFDLVTKDCAKFWLKSMATRERTRIKVGDALSFPVTLPRSDNILESFLNDITNTSSRT